jgi:hypothetical protein
VLKKQCCTILLYNILVVLFEGVFIQVIKIYRIIIVSVVFMGVKLGLSH